MTTDDYMAIGHEGCRGCPLAEREGYKDQIEEIPYWEK
jgi:hypothetical protein